MPFRKIILFLQQSGVERIANHTFLLHPSPIFPQLREKIQSDYLSDAADHTEKNPENVRSSSEDT